MRDRRRRDGWALLATLTLAACALITLAGVLNWANENATSAERNNEFFATTYAAESATEKVMATLSQQYQDYGLSVVNQNLSSYETILPSRSVDGSYWANYKFSEGTTPNQVLVFNSAQNVTNTISSSSVYSAYAGLTFIGNTYEIIANAQNTNSQYQIVSTVGQQVNLGTIPLFQFAIFYQNDMEITPGHTMTISGAVHGNGNIYLAPNDVTLTFSNNISAVGTIYTNQDPLNLESVSAGTLVFDGTESSGVSPLNLPVGTNTTGTDTNVNQNAYGILQLPTSDEGPTSATGTNLLYNKADLIVIVSNNNSIGVMAGPWITNDTGTAINIPSNQWSSFISTNGAFDDQRDQLTVNPVVLNVSNLVLWSATNTLLYSNLNSLRGSGNIQSIYVADERGTSNATVSTNYTYTTNYTTNSTTSLTLPLLNLILGLITTNTTQTNSSGSSLPASGTYVPPILATNLQATTNSSSPSSGTYLGSVTNIVTQTITTNTHNGHTTYTTNTSTSYAYAEITGYLYNLITSYTYGTLNTNITTNISLLTNWTIVSQPGVVLSNGAALPPQGLSIATPDPAYVVGNWNVKTTNSSSAASDAGENATPDSLPSAVFADAVTILSSAWNPNNSSASISSRVAASADTVNLAIFTGVVASDGASDPVSGGDGYSGGVENFLRLMEDWSSSTLYYNGSMVQMFYSQIASNNWPGTGTVYNPPTRDWAFDTNLNNPAKQPPMTPQVISIQRGQWSLLSPYSTAMTNVSTY